MSKLNLFHHSKPNKSHIAANQNKIGNDSPTTLADILPGSLVKILAFDENLPPKRRVHLIAYGLSPGLWVEVLQQFPVAIIRIDNTELALEKSLAEKIICQA
jgi:Fe2+ transport system protein FeoA